mgnify:CR=1 FL=1
MNAHQVLVELLSTARYVLTSYIEDFTDEDLLARSISDAHHAAWQLGHLISSEYRMIKAIKPEIPELLNSEFIQMHDKANAFTPGTQHFATKKEYLALLSVVRSTTREVLQSFSEQQLSEPGPEFMRSYAPTIGSVFTSIGSHELMHAGQLAVIRRKLGKPVVI